MDRRRAFFAATAALTVAWLLVPESAAALPGYESVWQDLYPGSRSIDVLVEGAATSTCQLCHANPAGGQPWNGYGWDIRAQNGATLSERIAAVEAFDSDRDPEGTANFDLQGGGEIDNDAQPGWTDGPNNELYFTDGTTQTGANPPAAISARLDPSGVDETCGNGIREGQEACDDGNLQSGDGCSAACTTESIGVCGDGFIDALEQCDDGNELDGDGCAADCAVEPTAEVGGLLYAAYCNLCHGEDAQGGSVDTEIGRASHGKIWDAIVEEPEMNSLTALSYCDREALSAFLATFPTGEAEGQDDDDDLPPDDGSPCSIIPAPEPGIPVLATAAILLIAALRRARIA